MLILDHDVLEVILSAFMEQLKPALNSKCVEMCGLLWSSTKRFDYVAYAFVMVCSLMMIQMLTFSFFVQVVEPLSFESTPSTDPIL